MIRRLLIAILCAAPPAFAAPSTQPTTAPAICVDASTAVDAGLQAALEAIDADLRRRFEITPEHTSVALADLNTGRVALLRADEERYAASLPKIGILLAYFTLKPDAAPDAGTRRELGLMAKQSNNESAAKFSRELGLKPIQRVLDDAGFYDAAHGGGLWVGKHYGKGDERYVSPVGNNSHAATARMVLRFFVMLEQDELVSPQASATMREIFRSPALPPTDNFFVKASKGREGVELYRKWGLWQDWHHDAAVVTGPGRHYVLVALTQHAKGGEYLEALATRVDDAMTK